MNNPITALAEKVAAQAAEIPAMYGRVDFSITPERFTIAPADQTDLPPEYLARRPDLLADEDLVARIKAYTMMGDRIAEPVSTITMIDGAFVAVSDGLPASASRLL
jgi:hypothetical protein